VKVKLHEVFRRFDTKNAGYITLQSVHELFGSTSPKVQPNLKGLDLCDKTRIPYEVFEAYLAERPDAQKKFLQIAASTSCHCNDPMKQQQSEVGQILQTWYAKVMHQLDDLSTGIQPQYVVDSEALHFEIYDA